MRFNPIWLGLCLAGPALAADPPTDPAREPVVRATALIKEGRPVEALDVVEKGIAGFDAAVAEASARGQVYCATSPAESLVYMLQGAKEKKSSTVLSPGLCTLLYLKAFLFVELKRTDDAVTALEKLTTLAPMNAHYFNELGYAYRVAGQPDKAMASYRHAVDTAFALGDEARGKRERAVAQRGIGYLLTDKNDLDGATDAYRKSLVDDPDSTVAKSELEYINGLKAKSR